jgi:hypothetical protein
MLSEKSDKLLHAVCAVCGSPIYWGETAVSVLRNVERLDESDNMIHTEDSVALGHLCSEYGQRFPENAIRIVFEVERPID